jgi:hypothetical protein
MPARVPAIFSLAIDGFHRNHRLGALLDRLLQEPKQ